MIRSLYIAILSLALSSCATTGEKIEDLNTSLVSLQRLADKSLPVARKKVSRNGREFYSVPFVTIKGEFVRAKSERVQNIAVIKVLGDRRPYTLEVQVVKKVLGQSGYGESGYDQGLARVIKRRIQKALVQRREDRNIIDDFKAF